CLSETGHWSALTPNDAIMACGGPEAYAALLAEAQLRGEGKAFEAGFEGQWPQEKPRRRKQARSEKQSQSRPPQAGVGKHTAQVIQEEEAERVAGNQPGSQRMLFEDLDGHYL